MNLAAVAAPRKAPRPGAEFRTTSIQTSSIATSPSLVFSSIGSSVKGYAAQPQHSARPGAGPSGPARRRRPRRNSPSSVMRSKKIDAACAAGTKSHLPFQGKASSNGT